MTVIIQAGNSDDKLTQNQWAGFVQAINSLVSGYAEAQHFFGGSITWAEWQNVCWVIEIDGTDLDTLKDRLMNVRIAFQQDSVAVTVGSTEFI